MSFENGIVPIGRLTRILMGYMGEASSRQTRIDMSAWWEEHPGAIVAIQVLRPYDRYKYFAAYEIEGNDIVWEIGPGELKYAGKGLAQITMYNPTTNQEYKSRVVETIVAESIGEFNQFMLDESDPANKWVNKTLEAAKSAEESKTAAKQYADAARQSADEAQEHVWTAQTWGEDVKFLAESAGSSSYQAQIAANSAKEAAANAQTAATSATEAAEKAMTAIDSIRDNYPWDKNADLGESRLGDLQPAEMRKGIKNIRIYGADPKDELYLSRLGWWTGQEKYTAEISKGKDIVCYTTRKSSEDDSGIVQLPLEEYNGSGVRGYITIDRDALGEDFLFIFSHLVAHESMISELCYGAEDERLDTIVDKIAACEEATSEASTAATTANSAAADVRAEAIEISKTAAPAIVPMATGDGIASARDSADRPLAGLHLYGKTTQDGTPSTATPVALVNAAVGSVKVDIRGKNLFNASALSHATSSHTGDESRLVLTQSANYGTATYSMRAEPNTTYTVSFRLAAVAEGHPFLYSFTAGNDAYQTASATGLVMASCTTSDAGGTLYLKLRPTGSSGVTGSVTLENIMVEVGAAATAFEPYKDGGSVTVSTPNGLPGIPVSSGGNYTDSNGQQWLCDEIDLGRGVYVQRVASTQMQNLNLYAISNTSNLAIGYHVDTYGGAVRDVGMCNALPRRTSTDQWLSADSCVAVNNSGPLVQIAGCTTLEQLNAYLSTHEIIVLSGLATPVEIALPSAAINAYNQMQSYKPTTTAINSAGIGMGMEYIADTKAYIDNKLAAIAAAMLEN